MPIPSYGLLIGPVLDKMDSPQAAQKNPQSKPHFQVLIDGNGEKYRIAINVRSENNPPDLLVYYLENFIHPILDEVKGLGPGFHALDNNPESGALDFVKGNLFPLDQMKIIPAVGSESGNDLNDLINLYISQSQKTQGSLVYAFGSMWGPDQNQEDPYFGFLPGQGIHDIHMNQGNTGHFAKDNGIYQDGALMIHYPDENRWFALFTRFQSQIIQTEELTAAPLMIKPLGEMDSSTKVKILAALINPIGNDIGMEKVYLINTGTNPVNLEQWFFRDKHGNQEILKGSIHGGEVIIIHLSGKGIQLSNQGGLISLMDSKGNKISGVSYSQAQIPEKGEILIFA